MSKPVSIRVVFLSLVLHQFTNALTADWSYNEQDKWEGACQRGKSQSPIALKERRSVQRPTLPLEFRNLGVNCDARVTNNGHTARVTMPNSSLTLEGGGLASTFRFSDLHFHWQSEHTLDNRRYPLEAHFVFFDAVYPSLEDAIQHPNSVAVVGVLFDVSKDHYIRALELIAKAAAQVQKAGMSTEIKNLSLAKLIPQQHQKFLYYDGSLTTPECNEVVSWFVFPKILQIRSSQLKKLTSINDEDGQRLSYTYRKLQRLNGRTVFRSF
ncbi:carbonic anhydrase 14-like [Cylas formicarius]|uniref:carbonic anhydrase 14-like n=1 Tax=Cylas formicarius TaxID=197179 RepID=UPI00295866F1|nr:carbonic anhydrase 14-like [Cylas formicarius]